jgi:hypothetical protein
MERLTGSARGYAVSVGGFVSIAGEEHGPMRTRQARIGSAIFFDCEPYLQRCSQPCPNLPVSIVGNANPTRLCDLETHCNIDPITKDIIVSDDSITDVNADAELDPLVLRNIDIFVRPCRVEFVGTSHGVDDALDDASVMINDFGIKKRLSKSFQSRRRAFFVDKRQEPATSAAARIVASRRSACSLLEDAPSGRGEIERSYSIIVDLSG